MAELLIIVGWKVISNFRYYFQIFYVLQQWSIKRQHFISTIGHNESLVIINVFWKFMEYNIYKSWSIVVKVEVGILFTMNAQSNVIIDENNTFPSIHIIPIKFLKRAIVGAIWYRKAIDKLNLRPKRVCHTLRNHFIRVAEKFRYSSIFSSQFPCLLPKSLRLPSLSS